MGKSRAYCIAIPPHHRTELFSKETAKTIAIALQGVQAAYSLIKGVAPPMDYPIDVNLTGVFFPLAVFGLMRLLAAPWITEDFLYADYHTIAESSRSLSLPDYRNALSGQVPLLPKAQTIISMDMIEPSYNIDGCFHPFKSWRGYAVRISFLIPLLSLLALCIVFLLPASLFYPDDIGFFTVTNFLLVTFFVFLMSATICIFTLYFFIHTNTSSTTVIPCLTSLWYKIYTVLLFSLMLALFIVSALETRRSPCGQLTTIPKYMDSALCDGDGFYLSPNNTFAFIGVAYRDSSIVDAAVDSSRNSSLMMIPFQGYCQWDGGAGGTLMDLRLSAEHMMLGGNGSNDPTW